MIKHLFKLIWNRKKSTSLLTLEVFLSFLVLFGVLAVFYYNYSFYTQPIGFNYQNTWNLKFNWNNEEDASVRQKLIQLETSLKNFNQIESYSFCSSFSYPYSRSMWSTGLKNDNGIEVGTVMNEADDKFNEVLDLKLIDGRWFNAEDDASSIEHVVVNREFSDQYFGEGAAVIGKTIVDKDDEGEIQSTYQIVGVIEHYKYRGELEPEYPLLMKRLSLRDTTIKMGSHTNNLVIKVKKGTNVEFEEELVKYIVSFTKGWQVKVDEIEQFRESYINERAGSLLIFISLAFFLILNVALGLMGVIWYSVNRRKAEIGLRRAIGATGKKITLQIIGEAIVLGSFAIIIGIIFAIQVPILSVFDTTVTIIIAAVISASVLIYLLITICSLYPSILASKIQPVDALHDD